MSSGHLRRCPACSVYTVPSNAAWSFSLLGLSEKKPPEKVVMFIYLFGFLAGVSRCGIKACSVFVFALERAFRSIHTARLPELWCHSGGGGKVHTGSQAHDGERQVLPGRYHPLCWR